MSIFKSCDIRGVYGDDLTEETMAGIGRGMASILRRRLERPRVVVAGDIRRSTAGLKSALIDGLLQSGAHVIDAGTVPTPVLYFAFKHVPSDACAMVTASHNPTKFNGLKLCFSHMPVSEDEIAELERVVRAGEIAAGAGEIAAGAADVGRRGEPCVLPLLAQRNVVADYERWLHDEFGRLAPVKMAADAGGGSWSEIAPRALRAAGFSVVPVFCRFDPDLAVRDPNPLPTNIGELCRAVRENACSYGAAFDGDGDRVVFVDELGRPVPSDVAGAVFSRWVLKSNPGARVVYEVNCSQALPDVIAAAGGQPLMERAGHAFMKRRMIDEQALFGVEISGHFFYRELHGGDDGLYSALMMGKLLGEAGQPLSALVDAVPRYYSTPVVRLPRANADARRIVDAISANAEAAANGSVSRLDGIRVQYAHGWALARVSVTEPVLSLRFEAQTKEFLPEIIDRFLGFDPGLRNEVNQHLKL